MVKRCYLCCEGRWEVRCIKLCDWHDSAFPCQQAALHTAISPADCIMPIKCHANGQHCHQGIYAPPKLLIQVLSAQPPKRIFDCAKNKQGPPFRW